MRRKITREDVTKAARAIGGPSPRGEWWVSDGYKIEGKEIVSQRAAPEYLIPGGSGEWDLLEHWRTYNPIEEAPDLFLSIASLYDQSDFPDAALAFCHKYGVPGGSSIEPGGVADRMSVSSFLTEARRARDILRLYEATLNEDIDAMITILADPSPSWNQELAQEGRPGPIADSETLYEYLMIRKGRGFVRFAAITTVVASVDLTVKTLCHLGTGIGAKGNRSPFDHWPELKSVWYFDNLLGAAYLQLHWLITSGDALARCEYCGRVLSLARPHPDGRKRRSDKRFCDDACRQAHHRAKKKP